MAQQELEQITGQKPTNDDLEYLLHAAEHEINYGGSGDFYEHHGRAWGVREAMRMGLNKPMSIEDMLTAIRMVASPHKTYEAVLQGFAEGQRYIDALPPVSFSLEQLKDQYYLYLERAVYNQPGEEISLLEMSRRYRAKKERKHGRPC